MSDRRPIPAVSFEHPLRVGVTQQRTSDGRTVTICNFRPRDEDTFPPAPPEVTDNPAEYGYPEERQNYQD